jgi:hypothetical protein
MPWAFRICEENLELIAYLNNDGEVKIEDRPTYFIYHYELPTSIAYGEIEFEDDLYDEKGFKKDENLKFITW